MHLSNEIIFLVLLTFVTSGTFSDSTSNFRILAPQFICPKNEEAVIDKPDHTIITIQTMDPKLHIEWKVRWMPLTKPTHHFSLQLWRTSRALEKKLNQPQQEPFVYVIDNKELLRGVNYLFNVTSVESDGKNEQTKTFNIDNTQGDTKLRIEGRNDLMSIILVGSQIAFADEAFVLDAEVTTCFPTQDYYFSWSVMDKLNMNKNIANVSKIKSSKLYIPPYSLDAGTTYNVNCKVMSGSNELITQTNLPFIVGFRGLELYLNVDYMIVSANSEFSIKSLVINHDYYDRTLMYHWRCFYGDDNHTLFDTDDDSTLNFPKGIPILGEYLVVLTVSVLNQESVANATITVIENNLPNIQIAPMRRILNEHTEVNLVANTTNVTPTCSLSWYFASKNYLGSTAGPPQNNTTCTDCKHGERQSDALTIFSLEEQFLSELADYTNGTEWRVATATTPAKTGRARFVAQCGCSITFSCDTLGSVYADLWFQVNESPKAGEVKISPETGTALETIFRISTLAATDNDTPLKYTFYCSVGNDENLLLAAYNEHRAVETYLPYVAGGTRVWVEVCDALGACARGGSLTVALSYSGGSTLDAILVDLNAYVRRCELEILRRVAVSAIVTYTNIEQTEAITKLLEGLQNELFAVAESCISRNSETYASLLVQLERFGLNTSKLMNSEIL